MLHELSDENTRAERYYLCQGRIALHRQNVQVSSLTYLLCSLVLFRTTSFSVFCTSFVPVPSMSAPRWGSQTSQPLTNLCIPARIWGHSEPAMYSPRSIIISYTAMLLSKHRKYCLFSQCTPHCSCPSCRNRLRMLSELPE